MAIIEDVPEDELPAYEESKAPQPSQYQSKPEPNSTASANSRSYNSHNYIPRPLNMHITADITVGGISVFSGPGASQVHLNTSYAEDASTGARYASAGSTFYPTRAASTDAFYTGNVNLSPKRSKVMSTLNLLVNILPSIFFVLSIVLLVGLTTKPAPWLIFLAAWSGFQSTGFFLVMLLIVIRSVKEVFSAYDKHQWWAWPFSLFVRLGAWVCMYPLWVFDQCEG
ncbi:hypothetical protein CALCODRAFT_160661 [Calocera cornea HHB12733]|uniref:Uncharacterized protein n=1 Tax=Calocera cornea HHB12733 TaxID=1353952 RepID=A0A165CKN6_9BASI|nr:hypothetical protein CALCODRAFT_160661 [Calocera cornea HHB12733]